MGGEGGNDGMEEGGRRNVVLNDGNRRVIDIGKGVLE